jgi:hypothetical protein
MGRLDDQPLAVAVGAWLADRERRERRQRRRRAVAVDAKTLCGARRPPGPPARRDGPHHPAGMLRRPPWHHLPVGDRTRVQAHGRVELRTLKAVTVNHLSFPHAAMSCRSPARPATLEPTPPMADGVVYAITSLPFPHASPARPADLIRGR